MKRGEQGYTLISIMSVVMIFTVMISALLVLSVQEARYTSTMVNQSQALMDCRSGVQAVYRQMQQMWTAQVPPNGFSSVSAAKTALTSLASQMQQWCNQKFSGTPLAATVELGQNNFDSVTDSGSSGGNNVGNLYQTYQVTVTANEHGAKRTMVDTFTISGALETLNYALYTPGDLFITGGPEIDGMMAVGGSVYFDNMPWQGFVTNSSHTSTVTVGNQPVFFYREPSGYEPKVPPVFGAGSVLRYAGSVYTFTRFKDQGSDPTINETWLYGSTKDVVDKQALSANQLGQVAIGSVQTGPYQATLPDDYVSQIIESNDQKLLNLAKQIGNINYGYLHKGDPLPSSGGWVHYPPGQGPYEVRGNVVINGVMYFDGDLQIDSGATLNLTQPLFVNGDLTVNGVLNSTATIYVSGNTTITNVPPDVKGKEPSRLELYSLGNIELTLVASKSGDIATAPTTFHAFLATDKNMFLEGMESFYHIIGGVAAREIMLNATVGAKHTYSAYQQHNVMTSQNKNDTSRRLWITYDSSYVTNPLTGTPTLGDLKLQAMPQPTLIH
ncbi:type IV pilus modification PilV family protein [Alicyclobacillus macrosporangiidus]|uniref:PilX N-terminal n=1 Tax=Alicyclobacillus macrosporangiidus TaxID=392015 RepID=A0A1I7JWB3_9BACL|nr:hypothetical protein [Alicyclobacillus macrosporangiidus]SFU89369.1 hypothetical protein SAMN05421543_11246 [Alicyclobacillus macrosporangiidus]